MISQFLTAAAAIGLLGAGIAGSADTRSFQAMTPQASFAAEGDGASGNMCRIDVVRTGAAGSSDITRQVLGDGSCVCTIVTGPSGANSSADAAVDALRRAGTCEGTPAAAQGSTQAAGNGGATIGILFAVVGVGIGALAGSQSPGG